MSLPSVIVLAPNSFARFLGSGVESQFQLLLKGHQLASLHNFDLLFNSPIESPRLDGGFKQANPMAGYYLESFLKLRGYEAHTVFDWEDDVALELALKSDPIALALSTTYITDNQLLESCIDAVKQIVGELPVIVGGPYIWKERMELSRDGASDPSRVERAARFGIDLLTDCLFSQDTESALRDPIYIAHEFGEQTLLAVLDKLREGKRSSSNLVDIPNLVLSAPDGSWHPTVATAEPTDLDADFTRWDLIDSMPMTVPLRASVGCPYRCRYCDFIELHPKIMMRSPDSLAKEIRLARSRSARFFDFVDDNIFLSKKRISELTRTLIDQQLNVLWGGFFRVDRIDESNIGDLVESGCSFGLCGIESADEGQLTRMRKNVKQQEVARGVELATDAGMTLNLSILLGYPGETRESLDNTIEYLNSVPTTNRGFASWLAYPFYLLPNTAADDLDYRAQFDLMGRRAAWRHDTMRADEIPSQWAPYVFRNVHSLPYHHYAGDVSRSWAPDRREKAFIARRDLTEKFIDHESEQDIQAGFSRLYASVRDGGTAATAPHWRTILAERAMQPGELSSYTGAFERPIAAKEGK